MTSGPLQDNCSLSHAFCPLSKGYAAEACWRVGDGVYSAEHVGLRYVSNETFDIVLPVLLNLVSDFFVSVKPGSPG